MKKILTLALAFALSVPMALLATAQEDIYYSKAKSKTSKKAIYAATAADVWETDANNDWDIDSYNRRGPVASDVTSANETYSSSYRAYVNEEGKLQIGSDPTVVHDTIVQLVEVRVHEPYYYSSRIWRFHSPLFHMHFYDPIYSCAYFDHWYNIYDPWFYDPWYYSPSFYWSWNWGWGGLSWGYYDPWWYGGYYGYSHAYSHGYYHGYHDGLLAHGVVHHHNGGHFTHRPLDYRPGENRHIAAGARSYSRNAYAESNGRSSGSRPNTGVRSNVGGENMSSARGRSTNGRVSMPANGSVNNRASNNNSGSRIGGSVSNRNAHMSGSNSSNNGSSFNRNSSSSSSSSRNNSSRNNSSVGSSSSSRSSSSVGSSSPSRSSGSYGGGGGFSGGRSGGGGGGRSGGGRR